MTESKIDVVVQFEDAGGNVFNLIGLVQRALNKAGYTDLAKEFVTGCAHKKSYSNVIAYINEFVTIE